MSVTRFLRRGLLLAALLVGSALPGFAQGVGEIRGNVLDSSGAILPGATVTLTNTQGAVGGNQETVSDDRGTFAFVRLVPGTYSVRGQLPGFQTVTQGNIVVNADATARADLRLSVGAIEEAITVTTQVPLLDTTNAGKQTTITKAELDALPNRTDIWSVTKVLPSVVMNKIDVGGSEAFSASVPIVRGATGDSKFMVDGMDVSSPSGAGTIANFYLDPFSFEETSIQLGAGSAETSTGGINFNMITRSGTNVFHGGAKINGTTPGLANGKNYSDELRAQLLAGVPPKVLEANPDLEPGADIQKMSDIGAWLAGPIVRDKLWFAGTWHDQRMDQHYLGGYNPDGSQAIDDNVLVELHRQGIVAGHQVGAAVLLHRHPVQAEWPFRPGQHARVVRRRRLQAARLQVPDDPPGEVHDADPQQHGVRRRLQPLPVRQRVPAAARGEPRRHRAVRQRDLGAVGRLHARHLHRRRLRRVLHHAPLPRAGTHQPEHCQEPPRPEGRLRVRGHHPRYAHLADLAVPGELSERAADEREHLHAAGGGLDRSARATSTTCSRTTPASMALTFRTSGR